MVITTHEKELKQQIVIGAVISTLISAVSICVSIYNSHKQTKWQKRKELEPLYEKMLSTIPKEKAIITKSDIFDEGDNLISAGMSIESIVRTLNIRKSQANDEEYPKIDTQIEAIKDYDSYWQQYVKRMDDYEDELKLNMHLVDKDMLELYSHFVVAFKNEYSYRGPVINTELLRKKRRRLEQAIIKQIY